MVGIVSTTIAAFFSAQIRFTDIYQEAITDSAALDRETSLEQFRVEGITLLNGSLRARVVNDGPISIHIIYTFWNRTGIEHSASLSNVVNPVSDVILPVPNDFAPEEGSRHYLKVVSGRGNLVSSIYPQETEVVNPPNRLIAGPFSVTYDYGGFRYTSLSHPTTWLPAFEIDEDESTKVFAIEVENVADQEIDISRLSYFLVIIPNQFGNDEDEKYLFIIGPNSTTSSPQSYGGEWAISLPPGGRVTFKFGSVFPHPAPGHPALDSGNWDIGTGVPGTGENAGQSFVVFFWRYSSGEGRAGIVIPFAALRLLP